MVSVDNEPAEDLLTYLPRTLEQLSVDLGLIKRQLVLLQRRQSEHENKTLELIYLYKGAGLIGKIVAWVVGTAGAVGALYLVLKTKL